MCLKRLASSRNFEKFKISGININTRYLTLEEIEKVGKIRELIDSLLENWDENSKEVGLKVKRYTLTVADSDFPLEKPYVKKNLTYKETLLYTKGLDKKDYKITLE